MAGVLLAAGAFLGSLGRAGVSGETVLVLDLGEDLPETRAWSAGWLGPEPPDFHAAVEALDAAALDDRVRGLLMRGSGTPLGWARVVELHAAVARFGESGKPVVAFLESPGIRDYALASAADRVIAHPRARLMLVGAPLGVTLYGELLEKMGIGAQFEAIGAFKNSPDAFTRSEMTEAHREQLGALSADVFEHVSGHVAEARGVATERARAFLGGGPHLADAAREAGFVDVVAYADEAEAAWGGASSFAALGDYAPGRPGGRRRIAVVHVHGAILPGESGSDLAAGRVAGAATVRAALEQAREMDSVAAVVLRIDSPGGADTASDTIWRAAERVRERKPVVASFGDVAASGGYWAATAARRIVASPLSVTGSIGVYAGKFHVGELLDKVGVTLETVFPDGAPSNNWANPAAPLAPAERERLREGIEDTYAVFLERVGAARGMSAEQVDAVGQGRVWSGRRALGLGLVDELGGLDAAILHARREAGIPDGEEVGIVRLPEPPAFADALLAELGIAGLRERSPLLRAMLRGGWFALLPFVPDPA